MPSSVLRPYNDTTDRVYIPILLKTRYAAWIPLSDQLFLLHPFVVSVLLVGISGAVYYLNSLFSTTLLVPGEAIAYETEEASWKDNAAQFIYVVPGIAFIVALLFFPAHWYHSRLWNRLAGRSDRYADIVDIPTYYNNKDGASSKFWCLEYDNQIVAAWGVDGRNPARPVKLIDEERIAKADLEEPLPESDVAKETPTTSTDAEETSPEKKVIALGDLEEEEDDEHDLALFRHSTTTTGTSGQDAASITGNNNTELEPVREPILNEEDLQPAGSTYFPSRINSSIKDPKTVAEIRHITLSETYKPTKGVESQILSIAIQSAFTTSDKIDKVVIRLHPKLEKAFRTSALNAGFKIIRNDVQLNHAREGRKIVDTLEYLASVFWPLGFESELLLLEKKDWKGPGR